MLSAQDNSDKASIKAVEASIEVDGGKLPIALLNTNIFLFSYFLETIHESCREKLQWRSLRLLC